jgi:glucose-6-phosphate isomerase
VIEVLKRYYPSIWNDLVVVISDKDSVLTQWGNNNRCLTLAIPTLVGGRFSVFTAVGLFPLALVGIDIIELCTGAASYTEHALVSPDAISYKNAVFVYYWYSQGYQIYDLFLFDKRLESWGKWYRQLLAESLGKENSTHDAMTLVPTVSIGTLELHSVAQLMLGARPRIVTTFITVEKIEQDKKLPAVIESFMSEHLKSTVHELMNQGALATQKAYSVVSLPYDSITLPALTSFYVGQLVQLYIIQVLCIAELSAVNPFDQPHVELYKSFMRHLN